MHDIATGTKDEVNGRFELASWAKSFTTCGTISRTITVYLNVFDVNSLSLEGENIKIEGSTRGNIGEGKNR